MKNKSEVERRLSPAGGKSKSCVKLPDGVTMTLGQQVATPWLSMGSSQVLVAQSNSCPLYVSLSLRVSLCAVKAMGREFVNLAKHFPIGTLASVGLL